MVELEALDSVIHERSYFDTIAPWNGMRRVALDTNKQVVGVHRPDDTNKWADGTTVDWTTYESNGWNCMVEIPKFYYKSELGTVETKKTFRWYISDTLQDGFKVHPAFVRAGVEQDYQYMSAFEGSLISGKLRSLPNKSVTTSRTIVQFRTDCQANGEGFEQQDFMLTSAIQILMSVELGGFDSQGLLDYGALSSGSYANTGLSLSLGNKSSNNKASSSTFMSYRGIENFYGNYWKWMDGINISNRNSYVADYDFISDRFTDNYKYVGFTNVDANGTVSDIGFTESCDFGFLGTLINGTANDNGLYDYGYYNSTGNKVVDFGGRRSFASSGGAFFLDCFYGSDFSNSNISSRLSCLKID